MMASQHQGLTDFYRSNDHRAAVEAIRDPKGAPISFIRARQPAGFHSDPATGDLSLQFLPKGAPRAYYDVGTGRRASLVRPREMLLAPPGVTCTYDVSGPFEIMFANIAQNQVQRLLAPMGWERNDFGRLHGPLFTDEFISRLVEQMWVEAADSSPRGRLFLDGSVLALLTALVAKMDGLRSAAAASPAARGGLAPFRLKRALACMDAALGTDVSLDDLAAAAGLSQWHFARAFKAETGLAPWRYLVNQRIMRAKDLLAATDLTIIDIAAEIGYEDPRYFAKLFRRDTGVSPSEFRRKTRS
jgi:AraC-like DNA-binding protein